jgi:hypothetical protein
MVQKKNTFPADSHIKRWDIEKHENSIIFPDSWKYQSIWVNYNISLT